jgi:CRP-like cAMP-binding protein
MTETTALDISERVRLLHAVPLLADADPDSIEGLAEHATEVDLPAGRPVLTQGQVGNGLFVVVDGAVRVERSGEVLARLGPGEVVGELSVIDQEPRNASVVTAEPTRLLALASWDFIAALENDPGLALGVVRVLARRLRVAAGHDHRH